MKIAVDARVLTLKELRGMASYLSHIIRNWPDQNDSFLLFTEIRPNRYDFFPENRVQWHPTKACPGSRFHVWDWLTFPKSLKQHSVDILWSPANICFPEKKIPQVVTIHDTLLQEKVHFSTALGRLYFRTIIPFFTRHFASHIITVSHFSASRISHVFRYPLSNISVIYNGVVDLSSANRLSTDTAEDILKKYGLPCHNFIYALGAESEWKNTKGLLKAFALARTNHPDIKLVISGIQEHAMPVFKAICEELGLTNQSIILLSFIDETLRNALYLRANCFVYPSLFEGFGLPPLEAMSFGTPVIASNTASIPEVVGNAAMLVNTGNVEVLSNAIVSLLRDKSLQKKLSRLATENVKRFSWKKSATKHRECFQTILSAR